MRVGLLVTILLSTKEGIVRRSNLLTSEDEAVNFDLRNPYRFEGGANVSSTT